jgi:hypothetical protein
VQGQLALLVRFQWVAGKRASALMSAGPFMIALKCRQVRFGSPTVNGKEWLNQAARPASHKKTSPTGEPQGEPPLAPGDAKMAPTVTRASSRHCQTNFSGRLWLW